MELRHLKYFVAIAEERGFIRAAARLKVAQPALSRQIRDLEYELGVRLFERHPRGARLTRGGQAFLGEARRTLENAARAVASAREADRGGASHVRFAHVPAYVYSQALSRLVAAFRRANPAIALRVDQMQGIQQPVALRERRVDLAANFVGTAPPPGIAVHRIIDCTADGVLLPASHPAAARERLSLSELTGLDILIPARRTYPDLHRTWRAALLEHGLSPAYHQWRTWYQPNVQLAAGGAFALANHAVAGYYASSSHGVVYRPFLEPPIPVWLALMWREDVSSPLIESFVSSARDLFGPEGDPSGGALEPVAHAPPAERILESAPVAELTGSLA